jgi:hypothetical protein
LQSHSWLGSRAKLGAQILLFTAAIVSVEPGRVASNAPNESDFRTIYDQFLSAVRARLVELQKRLPAGAGSVFDRSGNVFTADDNGVYRIGAYTMKTAFATGVSGLALVFDSDGNLLISDKDSNSILTFTPGAAKSTYASGVVPICFAFDAAGNLFVSDRNSGSILKFTGNGTKSVFVSGGNRDENVGAAPVSDKQAFQMALEYTRASAR